MKQLLLITSLIVALALNSYSQDTVLYVGGKKLKDVEAYYAQVQITNGMRILAGNIIQRYTFMYGQQWKKEDEIKITNEKGEVITFGCIACALNIFRDNGWDLVFFLPESGSFLLKKIQ